MPTYEYGCKHCGNVQEIFHGIAEKRRPKCVGCGHRSMKRLISPGGGLVFRGKGFYSTDYRSSAYAEDAKKEAASDSADGE